MRKPREADWLTLTEREALAACLMGGRLTMRVVAERVGCSTSTAFAALVQLRRLGLVAWTPGCSGTLRPLVRVVP